MLKERNGILAGGNWIVDHIKLIEVYPAEERLANISMEITSNGGAPYNLLVSLYKMNTGIPLEGIGIIGDDAKGDLILNECRTMDIDATQISRVSNVATSYTDVMTVQSTGRRTFFHYRGANAQLKKDDFDFSKTKAKIFHLGYLLLLDGLDEMDDRGKTGAQEVLKRAKDSGLITSVDIVSEQSNRYRDIIPPSLPYVDILFINELETQMLTDHVLVDERGEMNVEKGFQAAQVLLDLGVREWVIVHFSKGAIAVHKSGKRLLQHGVKVPASDIQCTVGAGDAFAAGVLAGIHQNWAMERCLLSGVSVAASSLRDVTSTGSIEVWENCLEMGTTYGWHS